MRGIKLESQGGVWVRVEKEGEDRGASCGKGGMINWGAMLPG